jgi:hypothetical protein
MLFNVLLIALCQIIVNLSKKISNLLIINTALLVYLMESKKLAKLIKKTEQNYETQCEDT